MVDCIKRLFQEVHNRIQTEHRLPYEDEFIDCLKLKTISEKNLLSKHFCQLKWNLGSCHVLSIYQKLGILSATEYILRTKDEDQMQLALNDFLETEYELLAELVINSNYDAVNRSILNVIIEECFRRLMNDTLNNDIVYDSINYLTALHKLVPDSVYDNIALLHCNILLGIDGITIEECFKHFHQWIDSSNQSGIKSILLPIFIHKQKEVIQHLFYLSKQLEFKGWQYYVTLLRIIGTLSSPSTASYIKKHLKLLLKESAIKCSKHILMNTIITARAVCNAENENIGNYQLWYKNEVSDIKFSINNNEFQNIIENLTDIVQYEVETTYLQVHMNTGISSPPLYNEYVLNYKRICKQKMLHLNDSDLNEESILLSE